MSMGVLESAVMSQMWDRGDEATVREVRDSLLAVRPVAYTTVLTVLHNLHRIGFVSRRTADRAFVYRAVSSREEYAASLMGEVLESVERRDAVLLQFVQRLHPSELEQLRRTIASIEVEIEVTRGQEQ
ncbi:BlaI/MecI/CopY family transcriptional regulator [Nocardioidaceae bacterium]|nr:BlaI/MecI/CopY family transcriptional regulator [Nocardioidaceae bacterium]